MIISSHKITTMGLLIALSIILTRIASLRIAVGVVEGIRIGFGKLPIILGGIIFGPLAGGLIGAFSDLLEYFINPIGVYMPYFTLTSALTGIIPATILILMRKKEEPAEPIHIFIYAYTINLFLKRKCLIFSNNKV